MVVVPTGSDCKQASQIDVPRTPAFDDCEVVRWQPETKPSWMDAEVQWGIEGEGFAVDAGGDCSQTGTNLEHVGAELVPIGVSPSLTHSRQRYQLGGVGARAGGDCHDAGMFGSIDVA
jgi:hypothetical protein